jgi:hypothetical protein
MHFFTPRLDRDTVGLAAGCRVVVVSANDTLDAVVADALVGLGCTTISSWGGVAAS